jgi:hypothetical protein
MWLKDSGERLTDGGIYDLLTVDLRRTADGGRRTADGGQSVCRCRRVVDRPQWGCRFPR